MRVEDMEGAVKDEETYERSGKLKKKALPKRVQSIVHIVYCTILYCTTLYYTVVYCTALNCTVLHCTVLYSTAPYLGLTTDSSPYIFTAKLDR